jgi:hypothetical protein
MKPSPFVLLAMVVLLLVGVALYAIPFLPAGMPARH